jgi:hypothetical protein
MPNSRECTLIRRRDGNWRRSYNVQSVKHSAMADTDSAVRVTSLQFFDTTIESFIQCYWACRDADDTHDVNPKIAVVVCIRRSIAGASRAVRTGV